MDSMIDNKNSLESAILKYALVIETCGRELRPHIEETRARARLIEVCKGIVEESMEWDEEDADDE